jgi:hypothetical protein
VEHGGSKPPQSALAAQAAERVEAIVAAAEASAREIEERAQSEAQQTLALLQQHLDTLIAELQRLRAGLGDYAGEAPGSADAEPEAVEVVVEDVAEEPAPEPAPAPSAKPAKQPSEGARLIALNMALSGTPREETARYLRENFDLDDQEALLDDVYAKAGS